MAATLWGQAGLYKRHAVVIVKDQGLENFRQG
jgi:hypothetical protein